jgi:DNA topoisomerase-3
MNYRAKLEPGF